MIRNLCVAVTLAVIASGCSRSKPAEPILAKPVNTPPPPVNAGIFGYNEPLIVEKGIGIRAVANGKRLAISIRNNSAETLPVVPQQFRILNGREQYELERGRDDLSGFSTREVGPGDRTVIAVGIARMNDLKGTRLVYNNPKMGVRFPIPVEQPGIVQTEPATPK